MSTNRIVSNAEYEAAWWLHFGKQLAATKRKRASAPPPHKTKPPIQLNPGSSSISIDWTIGVDGKLVLD